MDPKGKIRIIGDGTGVVRLTMLGVGFWLDVVGEGVFEALASC